ncbi:hypothetical protein BT69DRAFT_81274 [Atractiella rhizophila]|nr:hypothetical protein BT69DRAFT_81274 [Atractiella rhizophila]
MELKVDTNMVCELVAPVPTNYYAKASGLQIPWMFKRGKTPQLQAESGYLEISVYYSFTISSLCTHHSEILRSLALKNHPESNLQSEGDIFDARAQGRARHGATVSLFERMMKIALSSHSPLRQQNSKSVATLLQLVFTFSHEFGERKLWDIVLTLAKQNLAIVDSRSFRRFIESDIECHLRHGGSLILTETDYKQHTPTGINCSAFLNPFEPSSYQSIFVTDNLESFQHACETHLLGISRQIVLYRSSVELQASSDAQERFLLELIGAVNAFRVAWEARFVPSITSIDGEVSAFAPDPQLGLIPVSISNPIISLMTRHALLLQPLSKFISNLDKRRDESLPRRMGRFLPT